MVFRDFVTKRDEIKMVTVEADRIKRTVSPKIHSFILLMVKWTQMTITVIKARDCVRTSLKTRLRYQLLIGFVEGLMKILRSGW
jgi:hypothetical protein